MNIHPLIIQFTISLIAIFALFAFARWLKLGAQPRFSDQEQVQHAANEVEDGFVAQHTLIDAGGSAALAKDQAGRIMLIKRHGHRFAGRILDGNAWAESYDQGLIVDSKQTLFGVITIEATDPGAWVDAINRL